jgi:CRISPR-associated protein Csm3
LHIGGSKDAYEIGGMDNPVIKTIRGEPYIPGSSLKGKLRSLLEWSLGKVKDESTCACGSPDCEVCRVFGTSADKERDFGPTRLVVRDAPLTDDSKNELQAMGITTFTEVKTETAIDRLSGKAKDGSLRPIERVPEGTEFAFSMVYSVYSVENDGGSKKDIAMFPHVLDAMALLEDSYLGGMGSRGSGQVEVKDIVITFRSKDYYLKGKEEQLLARFPAPRITQDQRNKLLEDLNKVAGDANPGSES